MKIKHFKHKKEDFGKVNTDKNYNIGNKCSCGCSPNPYLILCDGNNNYMNLIFTTEKELKQFKDKVNSLDFNKDDELNK